MADHEHQYRSKFRTPKKGQKNETWDPGSLGFDQFGFSNVASYLTTMNSSPSKRSPRAGKFNGFDSPHKSGYFLRTPSPPRKPNYAGSPNKRHKGDVAGTPSPMRAGSSTDLFGNRSLLDNLPVPEWDENFLDNFQEDFLFPGLGHEDIEFFMKSPSKSPYKGQRFLSPLKGSVGLSPLKGPLLTSSPKGSESSPGSLNKTPAMHGRPLTRQRRLFLQSPERHGGPQQQNSVQPLSLSTGFPSTSSFSGLDTSASSLFSNDSQDTTMSIQNISSYLKRFDEDDQDEELPVMPPVGWMNKNAMKFSSTGNTNPNMHGRAAPRNPGKGNSMNAKAHSTHHGKSGKAKYRSNVSAGQKGVKRSTPMMIAPASSTNSKKTRNEPQFTLLKPQTEILNNQICLRMAPRTPPNKIKISRDFSQIQTLPSKEQLRIVRNRFRETLNKAVEQHIEKERETSGQSNIIQNPVIQEPTNTLQTVQTPIEAQFIVQPGSAPISIIGNFQTNQQILQRRP